MIDGCRSYPSEEFMFTGTDRRISKNTLGLNVSPVPPVDFISISRSDKQPFIYASTAIIYDASGRQVSQTAFPDHQFELELNVNDLSSGVYILHVESGDLTFSGRFSK